MRNSALSGGIVAAVLVGGAAHAAEVHGESQARVMNGVPYVSASPVAGIKFPQHDPALEPAIAPEPRLDAETQLLRAGEPSDALLAPNFSSRHRVIEAGWHFSGRVGPLRWLTSLEGDGDTEMRFGGRVYGQPRMRGMGNFNVGINYNFF